MGDFTLSFNEICIGKGCAYGPSCLGRIGCGWEVSGGGHPGKDLGKSGAWLRSAKRLGSEIESNLGLWAASPDTVPHPLTPHPQGSLTELGTGIRGKGISELLTFSPGLSLALV